VHPCAFRFFLKIRRFGFLYDRNLSISTEFIRTKFNRGRTREGARLFAGRIIKLILAIKQQIKIWERE
jgi:hypothetical protein